MNTAKPLAYHKVANAYDQFLTMTGFKRGVENFLDRVEFPLPPRPRLLDAGCGTGLMARYLAERFPEAEIVAFDVDMAMLHAMERELHEATSAEQKIIVAYGDLREPERLHILKIHESATVPDAYFDAIFVSGALEHVPLAPSMKRLVKLLRPGGLFFNLGVRRNPAGAVLGMVYRFRPYTLGDLRRAFSESGLTEIRTLRLSFEDFPANLSRIALIAKRRS